MASLVINITKFNLKDTSYTSLTPPAECHPSCLAPRVLIHAFIPCIWSFMSIFPFQRSLLDLSLGVSFRCCLSQPTPSQVPCKSRQQLLSRLLTFDSSHRPCQALHCFQHLLSLIRMLPCCFISDYFKSGFFSLLAMSLAQLKKKNSIFPFSLTEHPTAHALLLQVNFPHVLFFMFVPLPMICLSG